MPCFATGSAAGDALLAAEENGRDAIDATKAACEMAAMLRSKRPDFARLSPQTKQWVKAHDKIDRERREAEAEERKERKERTAARAKLTKRERELLNV